MLGCGLFNWAEVYRMPWGRYLRLFAWNLSVSTGPVTLVTIGLCAITWARYKTLRYDLTPAICGGVSVVLGV